jgi:hypothetical protein
LHLATTSSTGGNGSLHLTAGQRLTDVTRTRAHLENLRDFISHVALAHMLEAPRLEELPYEETNLPQELTRWLDAGALPRQAQA